MQGILPKYFFKISQFRRNRGTQFCIGPYMNYQYFLNKQKLLYFTIFQKLLRKSPSRIDALYIFFIMLSKADNSYKGVNIK